LLGLFLIPELDRAVAAVAATAIAIAMTLKSRLLYETTMHEI